HHPAPTLRGRQAADDRVPATVDATPLGQLDAELLADARQRQVELGDGVVRHRARVCTAVDHLDEISEGTIETTTGPLGFVAEAFGIGKVVGDGRVDRGARAVGEYRLR